jgi:threonine/homoserine/homoserine lactone efflux protein
MRRTSQTSQEVPFCRELRRRSSIRRPRSSSYRLSRSLFHSFIPQFVSPARGDLTLQFLILGATSVSLNTAVDLIVVGFAGSIALRLAGNPNFIERQRTASGAGMIGLGIYVAASK